MRKTPIPKVPIFGDSTPYENPLAVFGYKVALGSLFPGLGLLLAPVAIVLGWIAYRRYRQNPDIEGRSQSAACMYIGIISFVCQSAGLYCIARGQGWLA